VGRIFLKKKDSTLFGSSLDVRLGERGLKFQREKKRERARERSEGFVKNKRAKVGFFDSFISFEFLS